MSGVDSRDEERAARRIAASDPRLVAKNAKPSRFYLRWFTVLTVFGFLLAIVPWGTTIQIYARAGWNLNVPIFTALMFPIVLLSFVRSARRDVKNKLVSSDS